MPGFHPPAPPTQNEPVSIFNTRLGFLLFFPYLAFYALFVILNAFWPETMDVIVAGGINLGIVYGFALIGVAFLLALLYAWLCRPVANDRETPIVP